MKSACCKKHCEFRLEHSHRFNQGLGRVIMEGGWAGAQGSRVSLALNQTTQLKDEYIENKTLLVCIFIFPICSKVILIKRKYKHICKKKINLFTHGAPRSSKNSFKRGRALRDRIGIWKCWLFRRGENRSTQRKTSRSRVENQQQTQPTYDAGSGNRTRKH